MKRRYLETGRIVSTHGVGGEVKVVPWSDSPAFLQGIDTFYLDEAGASRLTVEQSRVQKNMLIVKFAGIGSIDDTMGIRGKVLYLDREDITLAEDACFVEDLLGVRVTDVDTGAVYGTLTRVFETGANDVYEITGEDGKKRLIPAIDDVLIETDLDAGFMKIRPLKGLFDDAD